MIVRGRTIGTVAGVLALVAFAINARDLFKWMQIASMSWRT